MHCQIKKLSALIVVVAVVFLLTATVDAGQVGFWRFEGTAGATVGTVPNILSPGTLDGTGSSSPLYSSDVVGPILYNPVTGTTYANDTSLDVSVNRRVRVLDDDALDSDTFTVQTFVKIGENSTYPAIISHMQSSVSGWYIDKDPQDEARARIDTGPTSPSGHGGNQVVGSGSAQFIGDGAWHHLALTWDIDTALATLWVDYTVKATRTIYPGDNGLTAVGNSPGHMYFGLSTLPEGTFVDEVIFSTDVLLPRQFLRNVPEPSSLLLLLLGTVALFPARRKRRR